MCKESTNDKNELNDAYNKVKSYLDINKKLIVFKNSMIENEEQLEDSVKCMLEKTEEIKKQAQTALFCSI